MKIFANRKKNLIFMFLATALTNLSLPLNAQTWSNISRDFPGIFDVELSPDEFNLLARMQLYPPADTPESGSFREALLVRQVDISKITLQNSSVTFDKEKYQRAVKAFDEIKVLRSNPAIKAYEDQVKVVHYYEQLLTQAGSQQKPAIEADLQAARTLLARYESQVQTQAPNEIQAAILRRLYRVLSLNGFQLPSMDVFLQEWPKWVIAFANQDYLNVRVQLKVAADANEQKTLNEIGARYQGFTFHYGAVSQLKVVNDTGLSDMDLMSRASVEASGPGQYDMTFHFTFAGVMSFFQKSEQSKFLPYGITGVASAQGSSLPIARFPSLLCFKTSINPGGDFAAASCGE